MKRLPRFLLWVGGSFGIFLILLVLYFAMFIIGNVDFSQAYRNINNYEGITFVNVYKQTAYKRTFWGLQEVDYQGISFDSQEMDRSSDAYKLVRAAAGEEARIAVCTTSPDGQYVLYLEAISVSQGASTDDDHVYYRVLNKKDGTVTTIYDGVYKCFWVTWQ